MSTPRLVPRPLFTTAAWRTGRPSQSRSTPIPGRSSTRLRSLRIGSAPGGHHVSHPGRSRHPVSVDSPAQRVSADVHFLVPVAALLPTSSVFAPGRGSAEFHGFTASDGPSEDCRAAPDDTIGLGIVRLLYGVPRRIGPDPAACPISHVVLCEGFARRRSGRAICGAAGPEPLQCLLRVPTRPGGLHSAGGGGVVAGPQL